MMNNLKKKIGGGNGFTLVEMLIVVAIIAILIAVSIPLINNALEKAKHATDAANERAAKAEILLQYMSDGGKEIEAGTVYYYDAASGSLKDNNTDVTTVYGKHKKDSSNHDGKIIAVKVESNGTVEMKWMANTSGATYADGDGVLCSSKKDASHS